MATFLREVIRECDTVSSNKKEAKRRRGQYPEGGRAFWAVIWPEPFAYEKTQDALKTTQLFPFSEEGKAQVIEWLNASWEKGIYKNETI